jgi:hypothetical protein
MMSLHVLELIGVGAISGRAEVGLRGVRSGGGGGWPGAGAAALSVLRRWRGDDGEQESRCGSWRPSGFGRGRSAHE